MRKPPQKPFDTYKWRWLHVQPSESLLQPEIFLGVLRAFRECEGLATSSTELQEALAVVEKETRSPVKLARNLSRNLVRNSGQYWKGTGLLAPVTGEIRLTPLGSKVAEGRVTQGEFAAIMVQQAVLPNPWTYTPAEIKKWSDAKLSIRPLALILEVLDRLAEIASAKEAYITPPELIRIVIPLAGEKASGKDIASALFASRVGKLDTHGWPDCAPRANDPRLAREFLLFLSNYGICRRVSSDGNLPERYYLDEFFDVTAVTEAAPESIFSSADDDKTTNQILEDIRHSPLPSLIERQRTTVTVLSRPAQFKFRRQVLVACKSRCVITGETISEILEAAHIIPVTSGGSDEANNGLCLRVDVHRLFDSGNIRLSPTGELRFSDAVSGSASYKDLPKKISVPAYVKPANVEWRHKYW